MKVGDLVRNMDVNYRMIRDQGVNDVSIVLGIEKSVWGSRYSGKKTRVVTEIIVYLANGKIDKWYSERVEVVNASR